MFIRELRHKNGRIYIQVVDKSSGRYKVLKSFGSSLTSEGVLELKKLASIWINEHQCVREIDFTHEIEQIEQIKITINLAEILISATMRLYLWMKAVCYLCRPLRILHLQYPQVE